MMMMLQYFLVFASILFLVKSEGPESVTPNVTRFYQLQHPDKAEFNFKLSFQDKPQDLSKQIIKFYIGTDTPCMFSLQFAPLMGSDPFKYEMTLQKGGSYVEGADKKFDLTSTGSNISYIDDILNIDGTNIGMNCTLKWMLMDDENTNLLDVLLDNGDSDKPANIQIDWPEDMKYHDFIPKTTTTSTTSTSNLPTSTTKKVTTTAPPAHKDKDDEESAGANIGLIVALGFGGFLLGCIIGTGCVIAYILYKKKTTKTSDVKTIATSKSNTTKLRRDAVEASEKAENSTAEPSGVDTGTTKQSGYDTGTTKQSGYDTTGTKQE